MRVHLEKSEERRTKKASKEKEAKYKGKTRWKYAVENLLAAFEKEAFEELIFLGGC